MFEKIVAEHLRSKHGKVEFPISTDDITTLIERDVADLDQYADLTIYGTGVEGVTEFARTGKPKVLISNDVHRVENRLRTTLTHEYGHVILHAYLFALEQRRLPVDGNRKPNAIYCKRDTMISASKTDWMEWQAGYVSGAALMPKTYVQKIVGEIQRERNIYGPSLPTSENGLALIGAVVNGFSVSREAATVRLKILGFLGQELATGNLFS
ncbi:ImmA/IrrE family metallo-endopeptidase [Bradyrhizobium diazoefficiens]|uniref:ImmA/IrrE family metallo-endopeptidase n=1 Tax=Bradyrhizobium diazoefficiens TaxID=1355477 RepID=UPI00190D990F|nr:ImmA/IrrE family metallo-endopeptidase [Bradyrhizobium diazoefficiens]QQO16049.1 ImmA/IrrE family metallo-endopeptidase [Bradyrhizobium diazoefficiens]